MAADGAGGAADAESEAGARRARDARADAVAVESAGGVREEESRVEMEVAAWVAAREAVATVMGQEHEEMEAETEEEMGAEMALVEKVEAKAVAYEAVEAVNWDAETMAVAEGVARGEGVQNISPPRT